MFFFVEFTAELLSGALLWYETIYIADKAITIWPPHPAVET